METTERIIISLRQGGHRITKARKQIVACFCEKKCPLSAQEIHRYLMNKKLNTNISTVYREIQFLIEKNILQGIYLKDGTQRYELLNQEHHHHLICEACEKVEPIELDEKKLGDIEKEISKMKRFNITQHSLEFYGTCSGCLQL